MKYSTPQKQYFIKLLKNVFFLLIWKGKKRKKMLPIAFLKSTHLLLNIDQIDIFVGMVMEMKIKKTLYIMTIL